MALLEWTDALEIGVRAMDIDHQRIVALMNNLHRHVERGASKAAVTDALEALLEYTVEHFRAEEILMRRKNYADYTVHCITHQHLLAKLTRFRDDFVSGARPLDASFFGFLKLWLSAHILHIDKKYVGTVVA